MTLHVVVGLVGIKLGNIILFFFAYNLYLYLLNTFVNKKDKFQSFDIYDISKRGLSVGL